MIEMDFTTRFTVEFPALAARYGVRPEHVWAVKTYRSWNDGEPTSPPSGRFKIRREDWHTIRKLDGEGVPRKAIAAIYRVHPSHISHTLNGTGYPACR